MKNALLIVAMMFGLLQPVRASGVVGKWYCSQAFLDSLYLSAVCNEYKGIFEFRNDGTFRLNVSGSTAAGRRHVSTVRGKRSGRQAGTVGGGTIYIRLRGRYSVAGGLITTEVDPGSVKCYSNSGLDNPDMSDETMSNAELRYMEYQAGRYEEAEKRLAEYTQFVVDSKRYMWEWDNRRFVVNDSVMLVDGGIRLTAEREKPSDLIHENSSPHLNPLYDNQDAVGAIKVLGNRNSSPAQLQRAARTLEKAVEADSAANLMFSLGNVYLLGRGVAADGNRAAELLGKAAGAGYAKAYHVLGMMYKEGRGGVARDFVRAYTCFSKGADAGNRQCLYAKGYMLYKGLGCGQDYAAAVAAFREAAGMKDGMSWYMLGICHRNGFGCMQDSAAANYCLRRAIALKCRDARAEMVRKHEETYLSNVYGDDEKYASLPISMPDIVPASADTMLAPGRYEGFMVMYDYSGDRLVALWRMSMAVDRCGRRVGGTIVTGTDSVAYSGEIAADGRLVFTGGQLTLAERYERSGALAYKFVDIVFDDIAGKLCGRLGLYSTKLQEPGRPVYFELTRCAARPAGG